MGNGWGPAREQQAKSTSKSGGGKLDGVQTQGNRGILGSPTSSSNKGVNAPGSIITPQLDGNKGILAKNVESPSSKKAPLS